MSPNRRVALLGLGIVALGLAAFVLPVRDLQGWIDGLGALAPFAGVTIGAALLIALVPRTPISMACGVLFGAGLGIVCALAATLIAAIVTFAVGRWLGRDWVARRAGRRWAAVEGWIAREGVLAVATVRAVPLGPYGFVGYAYGTTNVSVRDYALGSLIAGIPSAVTYVLLGATIAGATSMSAMTVIPLAFGLLLTAALLARTGRRLFVRQQVTPGHVQQ